MTDAEYAALRPIVMHLIPPALAKEEHLRSVCQELSEAFALARPPGPSEAEREAVAAKADERTLTGTINALRVEKEALLDEQRQREDELRQRIDGIQRAKQASDEQADQLRRELDKAGSDARSAQEIADEFRLACERAEQARQRAITALESEQAARASDEALLKESHAAVGSRLEEAEQAVEGFEANQRDLLDALGRMIENAEAIGARRSVPDWNETLRDAKGTLDRVSEHGRFASDDAVERLRAGRTEREQAALDRRSDELQADCERAEQARQRAVSALESERAAAVAREASLKQGQQTLETRALQAEQELEVCESNRGDLQNVLAKLIENAEAVADRRAIPDWGEALRDAKFVLRGGSPR